MRTVQRGIGRSSRDARSWGARRWRNSLERASDRCSRLEERGAAANARGELDEFIVTTDNNEQFQRRGDPYRRQNGRSDRQSLSGFLPLGRTSRRPLRRRGAAHRYRHARSRREASVLVVFCARARRVRGGGAGRASGFHLSVDFPGRTGRPNMGCNASVPAGMQPRRSRGARRHAKVRIERYRRAERASALPTPLLTTRSARRFTTSPSTIASPPSLRRRRTASTRWPARMRLKERRTATSSARRSISITAGSRRRRSCARARWRRSRNTSARFASRAVAL